MKQPELGLKLNELRHQKSLTQKEVSDLCNVDVRTIQRIETGEVIPRLSTLKLIAVVLDIDISEFNESPSDVNKKQIRNLLRVSLIAGIIYLVNFVFYMPGLFGDDLSIKLQYYVALSILHVISAIFLFNGFFIIGNIYKSKLLKVGAILIMITVPFMTISQHIAGGSGFDVTKYLVLLFSIIIGINGIVFGIGLLRIRNNPLILYTIAGILQIIIAPFFMLPIVSINIIGFWLTIPFIIILLPILIHERKMLSN
jgi:transcriptional regulator with XRE-family HTH domain